MLEGDVQSQYATSRDLKLFLQRITNAKQFLYSYNVPVDVKRYFQTKMSSLRVNTIILTDGEASVTLRLVSPAEAVKVTISLGVFKKVFTYIEEDPYSLEVFQKGIPKLINNAIISGEILLVSSNITLDDAIDLFYTIIDLLEFHSLYQLMSKWWMLNSHKTYTPNNVDRMEGPPEFRRKREKHLFNVNLRGKIILDAGSGFGRLIPKFLEKNVAEIFAIDISHDLLNIMASYLRKSGHSLKRVYRIRADIRYLPLRSELCDYICCISVIPHIPNDAKALKELSGVLKKGGIAYIEFSERPIPTMPQFYMWERRCDKQAIERLFATVQLQLVKTYRVRLSEKLIPTSILCLGKR